MNKVELLGRLTKDPEIRYTQTTNTKVVTFQLAINRRSNKEAENQSADFISIVSFGNIADICSHYLKKGKQVVITGRLQSRYWDDDKAQKHYVLEVIAEEVYFVGNKEKIEEEKEADESVNLIQGNDLPF